MMVNLPKSHCNSSLSLVTSGAAVSSWGDSCQTSILDDDDSKEEGVKYPADKVLVSLPATSKQNDKANLSKIKPSPPSSPGSFTGSVNQEEYQDDAISDVAVESSESDAEVDLNEFDGFYSESLFEDDAG